MSNFAEKLKWGGIGYAIRTEKNEREFDRAMKRFQKESKTRSSEDEIVEQINLKLGEAQALAACSNDQMDVEKIRDLISDIRMLIRELGEKTDKYMEFIISVMKAVEVIMKIMEVCS